MGKLYSYLSWLYRFLIIGVVVVMHYQVEFNFEKTELIMYSVFIVYGIIFTMLKVNKWTAYLELFSILVLIAVYSENIIYLLLLMPFVHISSSEATKMDLLAFTLIIGGYSYYHTENVYLISVASLGVLVSLVAFHTKFNHIEYLETEVFNHKNKIQDVKKELSEKATDLEDMKNMYIKSMELEGLKEENKIIEHMIETAKSFFNARYVSFYTLKEDYYVRKVELGKKDKYESPNNITVETGNENMIKGEFMQIPVKYNNKDWGVLRIYGKTVTLMQSDRKQKLFAPFSEFDFEKIIIYTQQAMQKLKEVKLSKHNEYLANNDFLTAIPNRRYFIDQFERNAAMASRGDVFSILILDIDFFKQFNDKYGHDTGDEVLKIVASTIEDCVRDKSDVVGRLGGEEFGVMLYKPEDKSFNVAERIRKRISMVPAVEKITVSIGLAHYGEHGTTWEELYNAADQSLYEAKETGRNKVVERQ